MSKKLSVTIDIGTTNSKVSLFDIATGKPVARRNFLTVKKNDNDGELFDLPEIWHQLLEILLAFVSEYPDKIDSINISSVGEAGVLVDASGQVVTPLIAWYDKRAAEYVEALTDDQKEQIYEVTGLPAHANYSVPKIRWLIDHLSLPTNQRYTWLNIPDLFGYYLTNEMKTEYSMASRTMGFDLTTKSWSKDVLALFELEEWINFPEVCASGTIIGYTQTGKVKELQKEQIAVRIAGHDHMVGALGIDLHAGDLLNSTGTTEGLLLIDDYPFLEKKYFLESLSNGIFTDPRFYTLFSSMPTGGNAFEWYQQFFNISQQEFEEDCHKLYQQCLQNELALDNPVILIPHLNGSGAPFKNGNSKGLMYGISLDTRREDVLLGIMLGLCLEMKYVAACFPMERIKRMLAIGPAVKNPLWLQLKAAALNKELLVVQMEEAVSFGALRAAYPAIDYAVDYSSVYPNRQLVQAFDALLAKYAYLYESKRVLIET